MLLISKWPNLFNINIFSRDSSVINFIRENLPCTFYWPLALHWPEFWVSALVISPLFFINLSWVSCENKEQCGPMAGAGGDKHQLTVYILNLTKYLLSQLKTCQIFPSHDNLFSPPAASCHTQTHEGTTSLMINNSPALLAPVCPAKVSSPIIIIPINKINCWLFYIPFNGPGDKFSLCQFSYELIIVLIITILCFCWDSSGAQWDSSSCPPPPLQHRKVSLSLFPPC